MCCGGCYTYFSREIRNRNHFLLFVVVRLVYIASSFKKNHRRKMVIMVVLLLRTEMVAYEEEATFILRPMTRHSLRKFHCSINTSAPGHPSISPYLTNRGSCLLTTCGMSLRKQCHSIILLHGDHSRKYIGFMLFFTVFHNIANITLVMLFSIYVKDCCT